MTRLCNATINEIIYFSQLLFSTNTSGVQHMKGSVHRKISSMFVENVNQRQGENFVILSCICWEDNCVLQFISFMMLNVESMFDLDSDL